MNTSPNLWYIFFQLALFFLQMLVGELSNVYSPVTSWDPAVVLLLLPDRKTLLVNLWDFQRYEKDKKAQLLWKIYMKATRI